MNFIKGCLFVVLVQCFLIVHLYQMQIVPEADSISIERFSGEDADPTNDIPDETPEGDGNHPYFVKHAFSFFLRFIDIPFLDSVPFYRSTYIPDFHVPPSRN